MMKLVEPRSDEAPTKRRRGKGRKKPDGLRQGTLNHFKTKLFNTKECTPKTTADTELRKRKRTETVEDPVRIPEMKSRRTMVVDDKSNGNLTSSRNLWGPNSFSGEKPTNENSKGDLDWVDNENDEKPLPGDLETRPEDR